jgi:chromosome segregation ATPase
MRSIIANTLVLSLALFGWSVCAAVDSEHKQYRWKDSAGNLHLSDTLTADALQTGYDVINDKGIVVRHIDRAMTAEERTTEEAAAAAAVVAKREAEQRAESDRRMLAAYPTENDLVRARQARIDGVEQSIAGATNSLNGQEQSLSESLAQASALERNNKPVPASLKQQIESLRKSAESLRHYIERRQKEKVEATKKLETDLAQYREARERSNTGQL